VKSTVCWDLVLCSLVEFTCHFGKIYFLDLQDRGVSQVSNKQETGSIVGKILLDCMGLYQKIVFFIVTAMRTSNLTLILIVLLFLE
jgi:hypothetical protein